MERLGFILGIVGVAVALIAFDPDRVQSAKGLMFYNGAGLLVLSALMLIWPLVTAWRRGRAERNGPIYLGIFHKLLVKQGLPDTMEGRRKFVQVLLYMATQGEIVLLGRQHSDLLEPIPPLHFEDHSLISMPSLETGLLMFRTAKETEHCALLNNEGTYDRLHVPSTAIESIPKILQYVQRLETSQAKPERLANTSNTALG